MFLEFCVVAETFEAKTEAKKWSVRAAARVVLTPQDLFLLCTHINAWLSIAERFGQHTAREGRDGENGETI
jgi:hypothetical protein